MKKLLHRLLHLLLILAMAAGLLAGLLLLAVKLSLPGLLRDGLADTTGFPVSVGSSSCSVFGLKLEAENIVINNSDGFPAGTFAEVADISADLGHDDSGRLFFENLSLHVTSLRLASSTSGQTNLGAFGREAGPLAAEALDLLAGMLGDGSFPPVKAGEVRIDALILPDGRPAPGFPRTLPLGKVQSAQTLLRHLDELATP